MRAVLVGEDAADGAQHAAGQGEARGKQCSDPDVELVLADVVLDHPQRQRHVAAEDDAVVLAIA